MVLSPTLGLALHRVVHCIHARPRAESGEGDAGASKGDVDVNVDVREVKGGVEDARRRCERQRLQYHYELSKYRETMVSEGS